MSKESKIILVKRGGRQDYICNVCGDVIKKGETYNKIIKKTGTEKYERYHMKCTPITPGTSPETSSEQTEESETPETSETSEESGKPIFDCTGIKEGDKVFFNGDGTREVK